MRVAYVFERDVDLGVSGDGHDGDGDVDGFGALVASCGGFRGVAVCIGAGGCCFCRRGGGGAAESWYFGGVCNFIAGRILGRQDGEDIERRECHFSCWLVPCFRRLERVYEEKPRHFR